MEYLNAYTLYDRFTNHKNKRYSRWISRILKRYNLEEGVEYKKVDTSQVRTKEGKFESGSVFIVLLREDIYGVVETTLTVSTKPRKNSLENFFGEHIINNLFKDYEIIPQFAVLGGKYKIDWYIPELKLAVEYDELAHETNQEADKARQEKIEKLLGCRFIRYSQKMENLHHQKEVNKSQKSI